MPPTKICLVLSLLFISCCVNATNATADTNSGFALNPIISQHTLQVDGHTLQYDAEVGHIAIRDVATAEPHGYMGYFAYRVTNSNKPRPLLFIWNGGPGAASTILHFDTAGPKIIRDQQLVDNPQTWLAAADLVFVDPIGTGYSRPAKREYAQEFYGTVGDVASVTEFVRAYRQLHHAQQSALYLCGESWGAGRAGSVAYRLAQQGVAVSGLLLLSGGDGINQPLLSHHAKLALKVADYANARQYHRNGAEMSATKASNIKQWALQTYAPALDKLTSLSSQAKQEIRQQLSQYTGIAATDIDENRLTISPRFFRTHLLPDQTLNTFDMRRTASLPAQPVAAITRYFQQELQFNTSLPYIGLAQDSSGYAPADDYPKSVGEQWNYATAKLSETEIRQAIAKAIKDGGGPPKLGPPLASVSETVALMPKLKVIVAAGSYDSLNSCTVNAELQQHLPPVLANNISYRCYVGGHMFYEDAASRQQLLQDITNWVK